MAIVNANGQVLAQYEYDPFGNIVSQSGPLADVNPLRYRGYVYDSETGFYYLQSRYYDPELGRFLNADAYASTGQGILGNNMFAYCCNNPILCSDPSGNSPILACIVIGAIVGAVAGGCAGAYISKEQTGEVRAGAVVTGVIVGGVAGGFVGWGVGSLITAISAAEASTVSGTIAQVGHELYQNWQSAEQGLRNAMNSVSDAVSRIFSTPFGNRVVDAYNANSGIIAESKYGYQAYSSFIQTEVARDAWLLQNGFVQEVQWHFYYSQVSDSIGGSYNLIRALLDAGIQVFYH